MKTLAILYFNIGMVLAILFALVVLWNVIVRKEKFEHHIWEFFNSMLLIIFAWPYVIYALFLKK